MKAEHIKRSIREKELYLTSRQKLSYYAFFLALLACVMAMIVGKINSGTSLYRSELYIFATFAIVCVLSYAIRKRRLRLTCVSTHLDISQIDTVIREVETELNWVRKAYNEQYYTAIMSPPFFARGGGETIIIIFNGNTVMVSSICSDSTISIRSMVRNTRNVRVFIEKIESADSSVMSA